ncbi:MAG: hypothetical protein ABWY06_23255 [Pseudomonas sp.]|uniref:hypothetical protein n=1 Tax=Pseudomonas sp. TaxID=306 RepID=UPI0033994F5D
MIDFEKVHDERFEQLETDFFRSEVTVCCLAEGSWFANGKIFRKDTGESLRKRCVARGVTRDEVLEKLHLLVEEVLSEIGVPADWGCQDPVRFLINMEVRYRRRSTNFLGEVNASFKKDGFSSDVFFRIFRDSHRDCFEHTKTVCSLLAKLEEQDLIRLVELEDPAEYDEVSERDEARILAMDSLFDYISSPVEAVIDAHIRHRNKMSGVI